MSRKECRRKLPDSPRRLPMLNTFLVRGCRARISVNASTASRRVTKIRPRYSIFLPSKTAFSLNKTSTSFSTFSELLHGMSSGSSSETGATLTRTRCLSRYFLSLSVQLKENSGNVPPALPACLHTCLMYQSVAHSPSSAQISSAARSKSRKPLCVKVLCLSSALDKFRSTRSRLGPGSSRRSSPRWLITQGSSSIFSDATTSLSDRRLLEGGDPDSV